MNVVKIEIFDRIERLAERVSDLLARQLEVSPDSRMGLATGATMVPIYEEMVRHVQQNRLNLSGVRTFNLDEYVGLGESDAGSFRRFMRMNLFQPSKMSPGQSFFPWPDFAPEFAAYDDFIDTSGGIDWQILGIGHNGHIGFNEPLTPWNSKTHEVILTDDTRYANRQAFEGDWRKVPTKAVTMGIETIFRARTIILVALGNQKRAILAQALHGPVSPEVPASILQEHSRAIVLCDRAAGSLLDK